MAILLQIYDKVMKERRWVLCLLVLSRRVHSIFMLRCFNDCFAMTFLYLSILLLIKQKHLFSACIFSIAVSVKMNVLLFFPGLLLCYAMSKGIFMTAIYTLVIVMIQVGLGLPFLLHNW